MRHFVPTLGIKETSRNVQDFVREHKSVFWDIFKPLIPYIAGLILLDVVITILIGVNPETGEYTQLNIGSLLANYFFTCLVISWHRVVIHGPDQYVRMNPLKPQKSELAFIGMGILIFMAPMFFGFLFGFLGALVHPGIMFLLIPLVILLILIILKVVFYFPSKATGNSITLRQSFTMTDGYVWKMFAANILAALKLFFILIGFLIVAAVFLGIMAVVFAAVFPDFMHSIGFVLGFSMMLPVVFYFQPLFAIIAVTVLSNYYQHALQNKGIPGTA